MACMSPFDARSNDFHSRDHNLVMHNLFNENRMRDVHGEQAVRNVKQNCKVYNLNETVKWSLQCNSFWMATVDTLKVCEALRNTGHSVSSSMGYFIDIMLIRAIRI